MRAFISGKIAGLTTEEARKNFQDVETRLRAIGISEIFNPTKDVDQNLEYEEQMAICFEEIKKSQLIVLHPTWEQSPGAKREFVHARRLGLHIRYHNRSYDYKDIEMLIRHSTR